MKKLFKLLLSLSMMLVFLPVSNIQAESSDNLLSVRLISFEITTDFLVSQTNVQYRQEGNSFIAEIIEKDSGHIVGKYTETPDIPINEIINRSSRAATSTYDTTLSGDKPLVSGSSLFSAYVTARVTVTAGQSWKQIDKVISCDHGAGQSGGYKLVTTHTYVGTSTFPVTSLKIDFDGIIESSSTTSISAGINFSLLETLGFSMSGTTNSNWYARKSYNTNLTFKVM